ncbi:chemotaxis protein CheW [Tahibacter amnicola]|uniref:Chemotaxis protein CheW n=1 Tax=Tahibacter amnicola TaxID=2976241 RepID=A0ABY6BGK2_9GAMM|nr:chemotaxis protein CheW [Tahibacter amnicola]UXI69143.1 chemotaxis protein CheW [Tahibacter amnicola]
MQTTEQFPPGDSQPPPLPGAGPAVNATTEPSPAADPGEPRFAISLPIPDGRHANLLLPAARPTEMVRRATLCPIPNVPAWFAGVLNLRGTLVPVFDLVAELFGESRRQASPSVLVVGTGETAFAIPIATEPQLERIRQSSDDLSHVAPELLPYVDRYFASSGIDWLDFQFDQWVKHLFTGAVRGRTVRRVSLQGN